MADRKRFCMRLGTTKVPGEREHRVDVCGLDAGHERQHEGKYRGMTWTYDDQGRTVITGFDLAKHTRKATE